MQIILRFFKFNDDAFFSWQYPFLLAEILGITFLLGSYHAKEIYANCKFDYWANTGM